MIAPESYSHSSTNRLNFEEIYRAHYDFVWRTLRHMGVCERDVSDETQKVFVTACRRLPEFEGRSSLKTWLCGIALRVASEYRRSATSRHEVLVDEPPLGTSIEASQLRQLEQRELQAELVAILSELRPDQRETLVLFEIEEMSGEDIARLMKVPEGTVRSRLRMARQAFSRIMAMRQGDSVRIAAGGHP